jgi:NADH:ubiquinone oxidoreductase subunit F (NADH-binding)
MGRKLLLEKAHIEGIRYYDVYRKNGGYAALEKAFKMSPAEVTEEVKKSGASWPSPKVFPVTWFAMPMNRSRAHLRTVTSWSFSRIFSSKD